MIFEFCEGLPHEKADCFLISYYRLNSISGLLDKYKLSSITTGAAVNLSFALDRGDGELYAILNKLTNIVPTTAVNAALASYSYGEQKLTVLQFMRQNMLSVLVLAALIVAAILSLLLKSLRSEKETREAMSRVAVLNTELSDNQQKLKEALAASEQASRAKTSFLSNMSHEIRTPMNAIIGLDNIALRDQNLTPHTREQLEKIGASAKHLLGIINDILEIEDIESERAENGQVAVSMFSDHPAGYYDAILMDVRMPVMNGLEATRAIRALPRPDAGEIPIIAMTANAFDDDVQLSLQAGMNAHLSKPVETEQLFRVLDELVHRQG